jgi:hypothetical protein
MLPQGITYHLCMVFVEEAVLEEAIFAPFLARHRFLAPAALRF